MANGIKTVLLLGLMSGVLLALGELLGGANGLVIAFVLAAVMPFTAFNADRHVTSWYLAASARRCASSSAASPRSRISSASVRVVGGLFPRSKIRGCSDICAVSFFIRLMSRRT